MVKEHPLFDTCPWAGCQHAPRPGAMLCEHHIVAVVQEPLSNFTSFMKNLPGVFGPTIAENAIYHAVNTAVHVGMFASHNGHDLMRVANSSRSGRTTLEATIERLLTAVVPRDRGEFMMHLKRHLLVPERRSARREVTA